MDRRFFNLHKPKSWLVFCCFYLIDRSQRDSRTNFRCYDPIRRQRGSIWSFGRHIGRRIPLGLKFWNWWLRFSNNVWTVVFNFWTVLGSLHSSKWWIFECLPQIMCFWLESWRFRWYWQHIFMEFRRHWSSICYITWSSIYFRLFLGWNLLVDET